MSRVEIARLFRHVREAGANAGLRVEAIQKWGGGEKGQSWCCFFATLILDLEYAGAAPVPRTGLCQNVLDLAHKHEWIIAAPEVGCLVVSVTPEGHAHHIAICTGTAPLTAIAGNTSSDGASSDGDGVYEHPITATGKVFVRVPAA